jgi:hypothetical protein
MVFYPHSPERGEGRGRGERERDEEQGEEEGERERFASFHIFTKIIDITEVTTLVRSFFKMKSEHFESVLAVQHIPSLKNTPLLQKFSVANASPMMQPKGYRDIYGRMLRYHLRDEK